jgi:hypothetical protein
MWVTSAIFKKLPKVYNNHLGENPPNLVALSPKRRNSQVQRFPFIVQKANLEKGFNKKFH